MKSRLESLYDRRDDAQSQLDALCGECPDVCAALALEIAAYDRLIEAEACDL